MCVQSSVNQYGYMRPIHIVGEYMMFGLGIIWCWFNTVLSFITHPQLSTLLVSWLRVLFSFLNTVVLIVYIFTPVSFGHFLG